MLGILSDVLAILLQCLQPHVDSEPGQIYVSASGKCRITATTLLPNLNHAVLQCTQAVYDLMPSASTYNTCKIQPASLSHRSGHKGYHTGANATGQG